MHADPELRTTLRALMRRGADVALSEREFNSLALRIFAHQFALNEPYRRYCIRRDRTPQNVRHWHDVPAVPTAAFKEVALVAGAAADAALVFRTSGTTRGTERRGTHFILDASLYDASLLAGFRRYVLKDRARMRLLSLIPSSAEQPDSSLSYMATQVMRACADAESGFYVTAHAGLARDRLARALATAVAQAEPVCLLGTSLAYVHWLDAEEERFHLPSGSRLMDTGGSKGARMEITAAELRARYQDALGVPAEWCINEYGMTEMCSQYYDTRLVRNDGAPTAVKQGPAWLAFRIVDPDSLTPVRRGDVGILQHFDLANLDSVAAIQTEDLAVETDDGFVLLGRAPGAVPRGCSIAMDILLFEQNPS